MKLPVIKPLYQFLHFFGFPVTWEKSVGAIVFRETDGGRSYLLLRYPSGHYEFPRGHVEVGETEEETARREVFEETGIDRLEFFDFRTSSRFFYVARGTERERREREKRGVWIFKRVFFYPARTTAERVDLSHEHHEFLWLPYREAMEKVTYETARKVLEQTESFLENRKAR